MEIKNKIKKIMALIVCLTLVFSAGVIIVSGDGDPTTFSNAKMSNPQYPNASGYEVYHQDYGLLADDWTSISTDDIVGVHFWVGWYDNAGSFPYLNVSIWSDNSSGAFSKPNVALWYYNTTEFTVSDVYDGTLTWLEFYPSFAAGGNTNTDFYRVDINASSKPFTPVDATTYWLMIDFPDQYGPWSGWVATDDNYGNEAVFYRPDAGWMNLTYNGNIDFAFTLTGETPSVLTNDAIDVTGISATLSGTLADAGIEACTVWFEYGETEGGPYPNKTANITGVNTSESFNTTINFGQFMPGTTIYYVAKANNSVSTVAGSEKNFTLDVVDITARHATNHNTYIDLKKGDSLNMSMYVDPNEIYIDTVETWEVTFTPSLLEGVDSDSNGSNGNVTWGDLFDDIVFEIPGVLNNTLGILNETVQADGDTNTSGTLFWFHFETGEGTGLAYINITYDEVGVAYTDDDDPAPEPPTYDRPYTTTNATLFIHYYIPTAPTGFTATTISQERINLSWTKDTTGDYGVDPDDGLGEYVYIERNTTATWSRGAGTLVYNGTGTSFSDVNISQNTQYFYQAWSYNVTDNLFSLSYSEANGTTTDLLPPGSVTVTPDDGVRMDLSWVSGDADAEKTYIERRTTVGPWAIGAGTVVYNDTGFSFEDTGLDHNTTYYYQLWAWDADLGIYSATFSSGSNTTSVLLAPTSLIAVLHPGEHHITIDLSWTKADGTDTTYIERNTVSVWARGAGSFVYNNTGSSCTDPAKLLQDTQYYYQAWSYNATEGYSAANDTATNTTDDFVPPTNFIVTPDDGIKMDLSWTVTDPDATHVYIERSESPVWARLAGDFVCNLTIGTTTFKDDNLDHNTLYYYQAWNYNATENIYSDANISASNTTSVLLAPTAFTVVLNPTKPHTQLDLSWTKADGTDTTYIERYSSPSWARGTGSEVYNGSGSIYTNVGLDQNTHYYYQAWSYNATEGYSAANASDDITTDDFVPPTGFTAVDQEDATIQLDWTIADADSDYTIIERRTTAGPWARGAGKEIYNGTGDSYLDDDVLLNHSTQYFYQAWAYNVTQIIYSDNYTGVNETTNDLQPPISVDASWHPGAHHTQIDITWTVNETDADKTIVEYALSPTWNLKEGTEIYNGSGTSYTHTGLDQNKHYYYQVWNYNASENIVSTYVAVDNTTDDFLSPDPFTATANANVSITLEFTPETDSDYTIIERNTVSVWARLAGNEIYNDTGTSWIDSWTNLDFNTTYYYQAWAYNVTENIYSDLNSSANDVTVEFNAPTSLAVIWNASAEHTIQDTSWANADINIDATVIEYKVGAGAAWSVGGGTEIYNGSLLVYVHTGLTQNTLYRYQAWSWNETRGVYSPLFDSAENTTANLLPPSSFAAVVIDWDGINLTWNIADLDSDTTYIEWTTTPGAWARGAHTPPVYNNTGEAYDHTGLDSKTTYYYQAWAYNATENIYSTLNSSDDATTLNTPPVEPTLVYPVNASPYCSVYPTYRVYIHNLVISNQTTTSNLTAYVVDPDGDLLDVHFYWHDEYIGTVYNVTSGTNAVLNLDGNISASKSPTINAWQWLNHGTTFEWYAIANDTYINPGDGHINTSSEWSFNTSYYSDTNEDGEIDFLDVSNLASHYRDTMDPGEEGWDLNNDAIANYLDVSGLVSDYGNTHYAWP